MRILKPNCTAIISITKNISEGRFGEKRTETENIEVSGVFSARSISGELGNNTTAPAEEIRSTLTLTGNQSFPEEYVSIGTRVVVNGNDYLVSRIQKQSFPVFRRTAASEALILDLEEAE